jgi:hypothetical protein
MHIVLYEDTLYFGAKIIFKISLNQGRMKEMSYFDTIKT